MKYTDRFFKFPVKLYLTKDIEERKKREEDLGLELEDEEPEYIIGWERVDIADICGYGSIFSRAQTIEDVKRDGFDSTVVYLKYGKEVGCAWPPEKFEDKLNAFAEKLDKIRVDQVRSHISSAMTFTSNTLPPPEIHGDPGDNTDPLQ